MIARWCYSDAKKKKLHFLKFLISCGPATEVLLYHFQQSSSSVKAQRVQDFVDHLPPRKSGSEALWRTLESHQQGELPTNSEETFWANIENATPGEIFVYYIY